MTSLVTGIHGFVGSHLADLLLKEGKPVVGLARSPDKRGINRHHANDLQLRTVDIRDTRAVLDVLRETHPHSIYHLAALTFVPEVEGDPKTAMAINVEGTASLLRAVQEAGLATRVLFVGSSEEYGPVAPGDNPIREDQPLKPRSLYGKSKVSAEQTAKSFQEGQGLDVVFVRPFNHIGPRQDSRFVCASFARQIAEIEAGISAPVMRVGNLQAKRDFTDARDTVRAYREVMDRAQTGDVFNVCSGVPVPIREVLDTLLGFTSAKIEVERDPDRYRPDPGVDFYGDPSKLERVTDWKRDFTLTQTLKDTLAYWRNRIRKN